MRPTGVYATYHGNDWVVVARGADEDGSEYVGLLLDSDANADDFDTVVDRPSGDHMAKVRRDDLDRYERVTTLGKVDGVEVTLYGSGDPAGMVPCTFFGDPAWADAHGFTGSQHDGWSGDVRLADITDVHEIVKDLLEPAGAGGGR